MSASTASRKAEIVDELLAEQIEMFRKSQLLLNRWLDAALAQGDADRNIADLAALVHALAEVNAALLELRQVARYLPGLRAVDPSSTVEPASTRARPRREP